MNGRRALRKYAQHKGRVAKSFKEIVKTPHYEYDTLVTVDDKGNEESMSLDYEALFYWMTSGKSGVTIN